MNYNGIQVHWLTQYNEIIRRGWNIKPIPLIDSLAFKAKMKEIFFRIFVLRSSKLGAFHLEDVPTRAVQINGWTSWSETRCLAVIRFATVTKRRHKRDLPENGRLFHVSSRALLAVALHSFNNLALCCMDSASSCCCSTWMDRTPQVGQGCPDHHVCLQPH